MREREGEKRVRRDGKKRGGRGREGGREKKKEEGRKRGKEVGRDRKGKEVRIFYSQFLKCPTEKLCVPSYFSHYSPPPPQNTPSPSHFFLFFFSTPRTHTAPPLTFILSLPTFFFFGSPNHKHTHTLSSSPHRQTNESG